MSNSVVVATHAVFVGEKDVFGPGPAISSFLDLKKNSHILIKHSLWDRRRSVIENHNSGTKKISYLSLPKYFPSPMRYLAEIFSTLFYLRNKKVKVFIGVDPINGLVGLIAKKMGITKSTIYYTADYAVDRFNNKILNDIYHALDKFIVKRADILWSVSTKIKDLRKKQGTPDRKNILIPNAPILANMPKVKKNPPIPHGVVLMANFPPAIDYSLILHAVLNLKEIFRDISITFIGSGGREKSVRAMAKKLKLTKRVHFLGFVAHNKALRISADNAIGLAIYANEWSWTVFGDSLKARESLAVGLPVIITNNVSTSVDIEKHKAGFAIHLEENEIVSSIKKLFGNKKRYSLFRKNAVQLAKEFDLEKLLEKELIKKFSI